VSHHLEVVHPTPLAVGGVIRRRSL